MRNALGGRSGKPQEKGAVIMEYAFQIAQTQNGERKELLVKN